jgi:hypothetical protein
MIVLLLDVFNLRKSVDAGPERAKLKSGLARTN